MRSASNTVMLAAAVAGVLAVGMLIWRAFQSQPVPGSAVAPTASSAPAPSAPGSSTPPLATTPPPLANSSAVTPPAPSPAPQSADVRPSPPAAAPAGSVSPDAAGAPAAPKPSFDVVRVEPTGDAVVAGRAAPNATVTILNKGAKIAEVKTDASGAFAAVPPALPPGDHLLTLRVTEGAGQTDSEQSVTVSVPSQPGAKVVAALTEPSQPTRVLSEPARPVAGGAQVTVRTVEAGQEGAFFASGTAPPNAPVRLYLNGTFVADVTATAEGTWALRVEKGMAAGHYDVRADLLEAGNARVVARAEVPFDYPAQSAAVGAPSAASGAAAPAAAGTSAPGAGASSSAGSSASAAPQAGAAPSAAPSAGAAGAQGGGGSAQTEAPVSGQQAAAPAGAAGGARIGSSAGTEVPSGAGIAVVREIQSVTVVRGDSLWRISRRVLGSGVRYTQIYEANTNQIRDPNRIWPGQILVSPAKPD